MNLRGLLLMLTSLALAAGAAVWANNWMTERLAGASEHGGLNRVVAAAQEIPFGTRVDSTLVKVVELPPDSIPKTAFLNPDDVVGKVAAFTIYQDEILREERIVDHVGGSALAAVLEEGKRAITVRVNDVVGVAGFLLPGNRVDVIATRKSKDGVTATTLLQNMKVLAVDQTASPDKNDPVIVRAVTLEAAPSEAEQIVQATQTGSVQLTLRNPLDGTRRAPDPSPAEPDDSAPPPVPQPVIVDRTSVVVVIRGTSVSETEFSADKTASTTRVDFAR